MERGKPRAHPASANRAVRRAVIRSSFFIGRLLGSRGLVRLALLGALRLVRDAEPLTHRGEQLRDPFVLSGESRQVAPQQRPDLRILLEQLGVQLEELLHAGLQLLLHAVEQAQLGDVRDERLLLLLLLVLLLLLLLVLLLLLLAARRSSSSFSASSSHASPWSTSLCRAWVRGPES